MHLIGYIKEIYVQVDALKKGQGVDRYYDPSALQNVPAAHLSTEGVIGLLDGSELLDVHHSKHNHSRNKQTNAVSFNFLRNYDRLRRRFGETLPSGCGGENLLIELTEGIEPPALADGTGNSLVIETGDGLRGGLTRIMVARPCEPFSKYVLSAESNVSANLIKETLNFLDEGTRGYYCSWEGEPLIVRPGDKVLMPD